MVSEYRVGKWERGRGRERERKRDRQTDKQNSSCARETDISEEVKNVRERLT